MAGLKPEVDWIYNPNTYWKEYGLLCLAGKWALVKAKGYQYPDSEFDVVTEWVDDRKTAIGFWKLLRSEQ